MQPVVRPNDSLRDAAPREEPIAGYALSSLFFGVRYLCRRGARFAAGKAWSAVCLLFSIRPHLRVLKVLSHAQTAPLIRNHPRLPFKYFGQYIALDLPLGVRRAIFVSHYAFLQRRFDAAFLVSLLRDAPTLWEVEIDGMSFRIALDFPDSDYEGDLRLVFKLDRIEAYKLIFVFGPGHCFGAQDETVLIVTNIQGAQDFDAVKLATKTCHDIQPAHILMAALSGLAEAAQISTLYGFHETRQISHGRQLYFSYEKFFAAYGEEVPGQKMYCMRLPYFEKPMREIRTNHRQRNLRKRRFKADIRAQVMRAIERHLN